MVIVSLSKCVHSSQSHPSCLQVTTYCMIDQSSSYLKWGEWKSEENSYSGPVCACGYRWKESLFCKGTERKRERVESAQKKKERERENKKRCRKQKLGIFTMFHHVQLSSYSTKYEYVKGLILTCYWVICLSVVTLSSSIVWCLGIDLSHPRAHMGHEVGGAKLTQIGKSLSLSLSLSIYLSISLSISLDLSQSRRHWLWDS